MNRGITLSISIFLTLTFLAFPVIANATTYYVASTGSNTFPYDTWAKAATSIQTAVDAASNADIIIVGSSDGHGSGVYTENVDVNKQITIQSENGYNTTTVVAASSTDHVFDVQANNVTIGGTGHGFSIYGATEGGSGINITSINKCTIENNRIGWDSDHKNGRGIDIDSSDNCAINNNTIGYNSTEGIHINSSNNNTVVSNESNNNEFEGITLTTSSNNSISDNTANNNTWNGILLIESNNNTIDNNNSKSNGASGIILVNNSGNIVTNNTANRNGVNVPTPGISLTSSSDNTLSGNIADYNASGINLLESSGNILTSNSLSHNEFGIYLFESSNNSITSNTMSDNDGRWDGDGIMLNVNCSGNTIANNTMNNDPGDAIELYNASNNNIIGNTISNSRVNVRINYYSSNNTLINNTISIGAKGIVLQEVHSKNNIVANNTIFSHDEDAVFLFDDTSNNTIIGNTFSNNGAGIGIGAAHDNYVYLNNFIDNLVAYGGFTSPTTTWYSPTTISYRYDNGSFHKGYLGNYYSDGTHTGDYGVGGVYEISDNKTDDFQLIQKTDKYSLEAWWLQSDNTMYMNDVSKPGGSVTIKAGDSNIWIGDQAVVNNTRFSGNDTWTGQVVFTSAPISAHTLTIEIGSSTDGSDFTAGGPDATLTGDGSNLAFTYTTDSNAFTVTRGHYLALRITSIDADYSIFTGGAWSFTTGTETETLANNPPVNTTAPATRGPAILDTPLSVSTGTWSDDEGDNMTFTYQWYLDSDGAGYDGIAITDATDSTFTPTNDDVHQFIYAVITADDGYGGSTSANSNYTDQVTAVGLEDEHIPVEYSLSQNYPNPFKAVTTIAYQLPKSTFVDVSIYNLVGQLIETLVSGRKNVGLNSVQWNASGVGSGVYYYRIAAGDFTETKKCVILK